MPVPKSEHETVPCEFYEPAEIMDPEMLYSVGEIARLLQELDPGAPLDETDESVLIDWAIPWIVDNAGDLVVAPPVTEDDPGRYGLRER